MILINYEMKQYVVNFCHLENSMIALKLNMIVFYFVKR